VWGKNRRGENSGQHLRENLRSDAGGSARCYPGGGTVK